MARPTSRRRQQRRQRQRRRDDGGKIPAHLLAALGRGPNAALPRRRRRRVAAWRRADCACHGDAPPPPARWPTGRHTQRLLTVVKAGSIQDVKATPTDKVHTWPHLLVGEFVA